MKKTMKLFMALIILATGFPAFGSEGVAIQRVITNTRSELGQLASSQKAQEISALMKKFDTQYQSWNQSCGGRDFDPAVADDACLQMADQMRETGISLYSKLADYLPDVAQRYEQGARSSAAILDRNLGDHSPSQLYEETINGIEDTPRLGGLDPDIEDSPFDLEMDDFPDPTEKMFAVLEKLIPDFGGEMPESVRAGNTQVTMMKKAHQARRLAKLFDKAKMPLEAKREYGEIIFNATSTVAEMPKLLGIQYTGTRLSARPNQKVLDYYRNRQSTERKTKQPKIGGFAPRS